MTNNFYVTSPIYYVNDVPHIGHAYTSVACDVIARFMRLSGKKVRFLTGTDEHGQKVEKSALLRNIDPQQFTDEVSKRFRDMSKSLNLSYDDFIRTTEERHKACATALWNKLIEKEYIYLGKYEGWYAVRDEAYYSESEIIDGKAPTGAHVEWVQEESYFFALSKFTDKLLKFYEENPNFIEPESRRNEVISFVKSGLKDLSVSRTSFSWGIKISQDSKHVMYVWLDALANYLSALEYPNQNSELFLNFWPASLHIVGKDILRFHAIFWPAFLMAADLSCPKKIFAHGWWTIDGQKMSKSVGNVIAPGELIEKYGIDQTRYFLLREVPFGQDGNFSHELMKNRINSELANNIGNLTQRVLSFVAKNCNGQLIKVDIEKLAEETIIKGLEDKINLYNENMENLRFHSALEVVITLSNEANMFVDTQAPWNLKKENLQRMSEVLFILCEIIRHISIFLLPFMPDSMNKILDYLGIEEDLRKFESLGYNKITIHSKQFPAPIGIFPRIL